MTPLSRSLIHAVRLSLLREACARFFNMPVKNKSRDEIEKTLTQSQALYLLSAFGL